jgi:hypothetical protein
MWEYWITWMALSKPHHRPDRTTDGLISHKGHFLMATSPERIEPNRRNAAQSTGPRTEAGKQRSRFNAVKHGMTAKTPILPGEDAGAFCKRLDDWRGELKPRSQIEDYLLERAVQVSWQLDRVDRAQAARIAAAARSAALEQAAAEADEALVLGRRLIWDPRGPVVTYPQFEKSYGPSVRASWSGNIEDPHEPARLLNRLESSALGCAWLLDRWGELRDLLDGGLKWQSPDRFAAIRLLGKQPMDPVGDPQVRRIYMACWAMEPEAKHPFADVDTDLHADEKTRFLERLKDRRAWEEAPEGPEAGRAALAALVAEQVSRLEDILARHLDRDAAAGVNRREFDDSHAGELVRRYQLACNRTLVRVLQTYFKVRNEVERASQDPPPLDEAMRPLAGNPPESEPVHLAGLVAESAAIVEPGVAACSGSPETCSASVDAAPDAVDGGSGRPGSEVDREILQNEPNEPGVGPGSPPVWGGVGRPESGALNGFGGAAEVAEGGNTPPDGPDHP